MQSPDTNPAPARTLPPPVPQLPPHLVLGALVLPNRDDLVRLLPKGKTIVEVGVALGYFSMYVLDKAKPSLFIAIDSFKLHELDEFWGKKPSEYFGDLSHADWYRNLFAKPIQSGQMRVMEGESHAAISTLPDNSVDIAYVDADHRYDYVKRDLHALLPKLRDDAMIIVDDYVLVDSLNSNDLIGVIYATHEFMIEHGWALHYLVLQPNTFYQAVLRRAAAPRPANPALQAEIALLRNSTSWRITAPMRAFGRLLRSSAATAQK
jgi:hypothetical protein